MGVLGQWAHGGVFFWLNVRRHNPIPRANVVARSMFGFQATIRVFWALDQVSSDSGSNVMPKIFQRYQEFPRAFRGFPIL